MAGQEVTLDFEDAQQHENLLTGGPQGAGQEVANMQGQGQLTQWGFQNQKNWKKTVCTYWVRGLCMKGDACGFLHQFDMDKMPVCRTLLKFGECKDPDCPYKHSTADVKECNMYKLGFCIYGPHCRFKHTKLPGPPPEPEEVEAAKPREFRNKQRLDEQEDVQPQSQQPWHKRQRIDRYPALAQRPAGPRPPPGNPPQQQGMSMPMVNMAMPGMLPLLGGGMPPVQGLMPGFVPSMADPGFLAFAAQMQQLGKF